MKAYKKNFYLYFRCKVGWLLGVLEIEFEFFWISSFFRKLCVNVHIYVNLLRSIERWYFWAVNLILWRFINIFRWFLIFFSKFCVGGRFFCYNMKIKKKANTFLRLFFRSDYIYLTLRRKTHFSAFFDFEQAKV